MMRRDGGILSLGAETTSKITSVLAMAEYGLSPAVLERQVAVGAVRLALACFTILLLKKVNLVSLCLSLQPSTHT